MTEQAQAGTPAAAAPAAQTPSDQQLILGKFKSVDDLAASYKALEAKLGERTPTTNALNPPATVGADGLAITAPVAPVAGAALDAAYAKVEAGEKLSDTDYASLQKSGFAKDHVDNFVAGRQAVLNEVRSKVIGIAGSPEEYSAMVQWAGANLSTDEVDAYNAAMKTRNAATMGLAVAGLKARYTSKVGSEPAGTVEGRPAANSGVAPFASTHEYYKATGSKEYRNNPDFRAQVAKRLAVSNI